MSDNILTDCELAKLLDHDLIEDGELVSPIATCSGEWRKVAHNTWTFCDDPELAE